MPSEPLPIVVTGLNLLTTYVLHSTLLLGTLALAFRWRRPQSYALTEFLWKSAALAPLLTAGVQVLGGFAQPVFEHRWMSAVSPTHTERTQSHFTPQLAHRHRPAPFADKAMREPSFDSTLPAEFIASAVTNHSTSWTDAPQPASASTQTAGIGQPSAVEPAMSANTQFVQPLPAMAPLAPTPTTPVQQSASRPQPVIPSILLLSAIGAALMISCGLLRIFIGNLRLAARVRRCRRISHGPIQRSFARLTAAAGLTRNIRLLESTDFLEPAACGMFRWTVVLPHDLSERINQPEIDAVLAHELAHLIRRDPWWLVLGHLLCGCLPIQPLNFLARKSWSHAAEFQCDEWAVQQTGCPMTLARSLAEIAAGQIDRPRWVEALPSGGGSALAGRVERLLTEDFHPDQRRSTKTRRAIACIAFAVMTAGLCWKGPRSLVLADPGTPTTNAEQQAASSIVGVAYDNERLLVDEFPAADMQHELQLLEGELHQLRVAMATVNARIHHGEFDSQVQALAARMAQRITALEQRGQALAANTGLIATSPPARAVAAKADGLPASDP